MEIDFSSIVFVVWTEERNQLHVKADICKLSIIRMTLLNLFALMENRSLKSNRMCTTIIMYLQPNEKCDKIWKNLVNITYTLNTHVLLNSFLVFNILVDMATSASYSS